MFDIYLLTLALAVGIGVVATGLLLVVSRTVRFAGFFRTGRGAGEKPRWGGLAIFLAFAITPFVASAISSEADELFTPKSGDFLGFLGACALVFLVGFWDDWRVATWKQKLLVQVAAASAVYAAGYTIDRVGLPWGPELELGPMGPVVTVLWVVFFTNAINLIDGRDGVAAGVAILAAVTLAQVASHSDHPTVALLLVAMAGGSLGFLPFNLPRASAYLGDSGALLLGFILGSLSIRGSTGVTDAVFVAVPVVALGFPILDTALAAVRRALDRRHPLLGDTDHIHHRLEEEMALGPRGILVVLYGISILFSGAAITLHYAQHFAVEVAVFVALVALVGVILARLGYLVSLWNSYSLLWLRRRLAPSASPASVASPRRREGGE